MVFESSPELLEAKENETIQEQERRFLRDQYHAGLWAPHPEFFLPTDTSYDDDEVSVFTKLKSQMQLLTDPSNTELYIYKGLIHEGSGCYVDTKDIVMVFYVTFLDFTDEPVDLAFSRAMKKPLKFQ